MLGSPPLSFSPASQPVSPSELPPLSRRLVGVVSSLFSLSSQPRPSSPPSTLATFLERRLLPAFLLAILALGCRVFPHASSFVHLATRSTRPSATWHPRARHGIPGRRPRCVCLSLRALHQQLIVSRPFGVSSVASVKQSLPPRCLAATSSLQHVEPSEPNRRRRPPRFYKPLPRFISIPSAKCADCAASEARRRLAAAARPSWRCPNHRTAGTSSFLIATAFLRPRVSPWIAAPLSRLAFQADPLTNSICRPASHSTTTRDAPVSISSTAVRHGETDSRCSSSADSPTAATPVVDSQAYTLSGRRASCAPEQGRPVQRLRQPAPQSRRSPSPASACPSQFRVFGHGLPGRQPTSTRAEAWRSLATRQRES